MTTGQLSLEAISEWPTEAALAYNDPLEDAVNVQLAPDFKEEGIDCDILEEGTVFAFRDEITKRLTGLVIKRASSVIELAAQNQSHTLRTLLPEETFVDIAEVFRTRRRGYAIVRYIVTD